MGGGPGTPRQVFSARRLPSMYVAAFSSGQDAPKTPQDATFSSSDAYSTLFFLVSCFRHLREPIFGGFSTPTWQQKATHIVQKSMPTCTLSCSSFSDRLLFDVCSQFLPPISIKSSPCCSESTIFEKAASKLTSIYDPILVPTWLHFGTKNKAATVHNSTPRGIKKLIDFCIDF